jgi:GAF domain-containing protein
MNEDATLRPVPETTEALEEVIGLEDEPELDEVLLDMGRKAREIAPDIVALSLTLLQKGLTFTLVASSLGAAGLDAAQYLDNDGPCLRAVDEGEVVETRIEELLDEGQWQTFARSSAALGVASSLSMPTVKDGRVTGGINLYASTAHAFAGHQQALAEALGASAADAVANADLSFSTRRQAVEAPARMRALNDIDTAIGILAATQLESVEEARQRLRDSAVRAGVDEALVARVLLHVYTDR